MIQSAKIIDIIEYREVFGHPFLYSVLILDIGKYIHIGRDNLTNIIGDSQVGDTILIDKRANHIKGVL